MICLVKARQIHVIRQILVQGGCRIVANSDASLTVTANFFGCDKEELRAALVSRMMQTSIGGRRGSAIL